MKQFWSVIGEFLLDQGLELGSTGVLVETSPQCFPLSTTPRLDWIVFFYR